VTPPLPRPHGDRVVLRPPAAGDLDPLAEELR